MFNKFFRFLKQWCVESLVFSLKQCFPPPWASLSVCHFVKRPAALSFRSIVFPFLFPLLSFLVISLLYSLVTVWSSYLLPPLVFFCPARGSSSPPSGLVFCVEPSSWGSRRSRGAGLRMSECGTLPHCIILTLPTGLHFPVTLPCSSFSLFYFPISLNTFLPPRSLPLLPLRMMGNFWGGKLVKKQKYRFGFIFHSSDDVIYWNAL